MYYAMRASAPSLHRESTDSLINKKCIFEVVVGFAKFGLTLVESFLHF